MDLSVENKITNSAILLSTCLLCVYLYLKYRLSYWKRRGIYNNKPNIIFGNATRILFRKYPFALTFKDLYHQFKKQGLKYGGFYFMSRPAIVPIDPSIIKSILITDFQHFTDHGIYVNEDVDPINANIFTYHGQKVC